MRLELGARVDCIDGTFGELADVVIDPTTRRVTHLVVEAQEEPSVATLVPVELVDREQSARALTLRVTGGEVRALPPVQDVAYLQLGDFPLDDPDWDVGIQEVYALPYYATSDVEARALDFPVMYDRIPEGRSRDSARERRSTPPRDTTSDTWTVSSSIATSTSLTSSSSADTSGAGATSRSPSAPSPRSRPTT